MSFLGQIFAGDEELGKKDDDHRPVNGDAKSAPWSSRKPARGPQWRVQWRKMIYGICGVLFLYLFVQNIPTDLGPNNRRADSRVYQGPIDGKRPPPYTESVKNQPPRPTAASEAEEHYHNGPIKFYKLAVSLQAAAKMGGQMQTNKNVMFAASSLKSVSEIVPLACEMARWERNDVHLVLMGRDDMEVQQLKEVNGAVEDCNVHWHDARPDFSQWSSDFRMEVSVTAGMEHIQTFLHPQIIITDDPAREDSFFIDAIRSKAADLGKGLIELPPEAAETMMWMARLDSGSLAAWPTTYVDILIQAPKGSSGSLVRLMRSIEDADYFGARRPHITVELPAEIDQPTWRYLQNLVWPPLDWSGAPHASQVTLRHRIPRRTTSEEEASARLVESFYPLRTEDSSVLLLSPQVQLSPLYYHYLMYTLLEYRYADYNRKAKDAPDLMGISLDLPSTYANDTTGFEPPRRTSSSGEDREETPFRWQLPNANAALYFGNKWMEFHSFISNRLSKPPTTSPKVFSKSHPAWLEYMLELMRARGYSLLYPNFPSEELNLATIHSDLYQVPEEFTQKKARSSSPSLSTNDDFTVDLTNVKPPKNERTLLENNLVSLLPSAGDLPELANLPLLNYEGGSITGEQSGVSSFAFSNTFRTENGGCKNQKEQEGRQPCSANDLFCHLNEDPYDYHAAAGGTDKKVDQAQPPVTYPQFAHPGANLDFSETEIVTDDDKISDEAANEAKTSGETDRHLDRTGEKEYAAQKAAAAAVAAAMPAKDDQNAPPVRNAPKQKTFREIQEEKEFQENLHPIPSELDANDEWQTQFRGQLERQQQQQATTSTTTTTESDKDADKANGGGGGGKKTEKESKSESESPKHGTFNKEAPKQAREEEVVDAQAADKKEKGPGW